MFVQVIKGRTDDPAALAAAGDRWVEEVRPAAVGYLGGTFGIADDGTFVILARFEDDVAAKANADRPEQSAWWESARAAMAGDPTFRESSDVQTLFGGGCDDAGFVQVMEGTAKDRAKAAAFETDDMLAQLRAARPDLLGVLRVWFEGDRFLEAAYFTSEAAAREGESSAEFSGPQADFAALFGEMTYLDLPNPRFS